MKVVQITLRSSLFLKATSLIIGYLLWSTVGDLFLRRTWMTVPVCFYNTEGKKMSAPESVSLELEGKRRYLRKITNDTLAIHIDAQSLKQGTHQITVTRELLLMPPGIEIATALPQSIMVSVQKGTL